MSGLIAACTLILPAPLLLGTSAASAQTPAALPPGAPPSGTVVATVGTDGGVWIKANVPNIGSGYGNVNPSSWVGLAGRVLSPPAVVNVGGQPYYIAVGTDHNLYVRTLNTAWNLASAPGTFCNDSPGAAWNAISRILYIGCQGADHGLWVTAVPVTPGSVSFPFVGFTNYGGDLSAGPAVAYLGGTVNFLAVTPTGLVYYHGPSVGSPWVATNANCSFHLSADTTPVPGIPGGACRGADGQAWARKFVAFPIAAPFSTPQGGALLGGPGFADYSCDTGAAIVFAEGTDGAVWYHYVGDPTYTWYSIGGVVMGTTGAEAAALPNTC
jgi:hypothetical protein